MSSPVAFAIMAAAAQPVAAPPPLTVIQPAPRPAEEAAIQAISRFDVVIAAGGDILWSGAVRVGVAAANASQTLTQAAEPCAGEAAPPRYSHTSRRQISFSLARRGTRETDAFSINVQWQRPAGACQSGGTRGVTLEQQVNITPGETVRLKGDAGLEVTLTRRAR